MAWSLDWFAAAELAKAGAPIRRVAWTDRTLVRHDALWLLVTATASHVVKATDFGAADLNARDWTDQPFNGDPCAATPAFNSAPVAYGEWTDEPMQAAPPPPGFPSVP